MYVTYCQETEVTEKLPHEYMPLEEAKKLPDHLLIEELRNSRPMISRYKKLREELLYERGRAETKRYKSRKRKLEGRE